jgi:hypothetical protein
MQNRNRNYQRTIPQVMSLYQVDGNNWTIPLNVIMVEITFGGSITPICHGAGIRHKTLSDFVVEVEYVDPMGNLRTVSVQLNFVLQLGRLDCWVLRPIPFVWIK